MKRGTRKNCFGKNIGLVVTYDPKDDTATLSLSFWFLSPFHSKLKKRNKDGPEGNYFCVVLPKALSFLFKTPHILAF